MPNEMQRKILSALFSLMKPIAKALMGAGVTYPEFAEVSKAAFVQTAQKTYGVRGRNANLSRTAIITGLSRKEVRRLSAWSPQDESLLINVENPLIDLLHIWHTDIGYIDSEGLPIEIPEKGAKPSLVDLVGRVGCDVPVGAIKKELIRFGAIVEEPTSLLRAKSRTYISGSGDERLHESLVSTLQRHAETIAFNAETFNSGKTRSDQIVESLPIDPKLLPKLRRVTRERLIQFALDYDDYITQFEQDDANDQCPGTKAGIGLYYFEKSDY